MQQALDNALPPLGDSIRDLDDESFGQVILAARPWRAEAGDVIIQQGEQLEENAPGLYVLESGVLHAYKQARDEEFPGTLVKAYTANGEVFGELALLHGAPRAATVVAACDSYLWSIDRSTMQSARLRCTEARRSLYDKLLCKVEILSPLGRFERAQLIDNLRPSRYNKDDTIIQQGDEGTQFFLLVLGEAVAKKNGQVVAHYLSGSCFGELALLYDQPRQASVVAATECTCASLDRESFNRLLGPLESWRGHANTYKSSQPGQDEVNKVHEASCEKLGQVHCRAEELVLECHCLGRVSTETCVASQQLEVQEACCSVVASKHTELPNEAHQAQCTSSRTPGTQSKSSLVALREVLSEPQKTHKHRRSSSRALLQEHLETSQNVGEQFGASHLLLRASPRTIAHRTPSFLRPEGCRCRTPSPPDYCMSREDRLCYDSEEELDGPPLQAQARRHQDPMSVLEETAPLCAL